MVTVLDQILSRAAFAVDLTWVLELELRQVEGFLAMTSKLYFGTLKQSGIFLVFVYFGK